MSSEDPCTHHFIKYYTLVILCEHFLMKQKNTDTVEAPILPLCPYPPISFLLFSSAKIITISNWVFIMNTIVKEVSLTYKIFTFYLKIIIYYPPWRILLFPIDILKYVSILGHMSMGSSTSHLCVCPSLSRGPLSTFCFDGSLDWIFLSANILADPSIVRNLHFFLILLVWNVLFSFIENNTLFSV